MFFSAFFSRADIPKFLILSLSFFVGRRDTISETWSQFNRCKLTEVKNSPYITECSLQLIHPFHITFMNKLGEKRT